MLFQEVFYDRYESDQMFRRGPRSDSQPWIRLLYHFILMKNGLIYKPACDLEFIKCPDYGFDLPCVYLTRGKLLHFFKNRLIPGRKCSNQMDKTRPLFMSRKKILKLH